MLSVGFEQTFMKFIEIIENLFFENNFFTGKNIAGTISVTITCI